MKANTKTEFKQWQILPDLSRSSGEASTTNSNQDCRASESSGPSLAKAGRIECLTRNQSESRQKLSTKRIPQRP